MKIFKKIFIAFAFVFAVFGLPTATIFAEASITSVNFTWTGYEPSASVYFTYSGWQNMDGTQDGFIVYLPLAVNVSSGSTVQVRSLSEGYNVTLSFADILAYDFQTRFYIPFSYFGANYYAVYDFQIYFTLKYQGSYLNSLSNAVTYSDTYFGCFSSADLFVVSDISTYGTGFNDGYEQGLIDGGLDSFALGYADGLIDGDASGYVDGYDDGYLEGFNVNASAQYASGYQDGLDSGDDINLLLTIPAMILGIIWQIAVSFLQFDVFGISLWWMLSGVGIILVVIMVIKH